MMGVVIEPVFHHQKGQIYNAQHQTVKSLAEQGLNLDQTFFLQFEAKSDARDARPTAYPCRVAVPHDCKEHEYSFKNCDILRLGRTAVVPMLPGKSMVSEIPVTTPLPSQVSMDLNQTHAGPRGGKRFEQIGADAVLALLDASLDHCENSFDAWLMSSLNVGVGHEVEAFIRKRATLAKPGFFWGVCEAESQAEWVREETKQWLANQLQNQQISLPGVKTFEPKGQSDTDGQANLTPPVLEVLKLCPDGVVRLPQAVYNTWMLHPRFKAQFEAALAATSQDLGYKEIGVISPEELCEIPNKRHSMDISSPSPVKKAKTDMPENPSLTVVPMDQVPANAEARIWWSTQKAEKQYYTVVGAGSRKQVWLVNSGDSALRHKANAPAMGHGQVKWRFAEGGEDDVKPEELTFRLAADGWVYHNSKELIKVMAVVEETKKTKPNCKVAYHKMVEAHDQVGVFSLEPEVEVRCVRATVEASGDAKLIVSSAGPVIHCDWWDGSPFVVATWATRWTAQGLMPVRPIEVFTQDIEVPPKSAALLNP